MVAWRRSRGDVARELIAAFSLEGISGGAAVFDPEKLDWFNTQYLAKLTADDLVQRVRRCCGPRVYGATSTGRGQARVAERVLRLVLPRVRRLPDSLSRSAPFLTATVEYDREAVRKHLTTADLDRHVEALIAAWRQNRTLRRSGDRARAAQRRRARGIKAAALIHAARIAATGKAVSLGIFEVLALLGKPLTLSRLSRPRALYAAPDPR